MWLKFTTNLDDEASVLGFLCHLIKMQPLFSAKEDLNLLDETSLVTNIKSNMIRYGDSKAISKYGTLGEILTYFTRIYVNDPNSLCLVINPIYELPVPYSIKNAMKNIKYSRKHSFFCENCKAD